MATIDGFFEKYTFLCQMYREEADEIVTLILNFFPFDNSIQVIDSKKGKNLVKRTHAPGIRREMLEIGNIINVFSRLLYIKDCAPHTHSIFLQNSERNFVLIKPLAPELHGKIINLINVNGFTIVNLKSTKLSKDGAITLYKYMTGTTPMPLIINYITSGDVIGIEISGSNAIARFRTFLGATDPRNAAPGTLRHIFGEDTLRNAVHSANSCEEVGQMVDLFFGFKNGVPNIPYQASCEECTCCIIKPHAILDGRIGAVVERIATAGKFYISHMAMLNVPLSCAMEFYAVYKNVLPEYRAMCVQLAESKCLALEVKAVDPSVEVVSEFRKLCGPRDPDMCRVLYPHSIRALYGTDTIYNAVHCTDLPEDGVTEVEYIFKLLTKYKSVF